MDTAILIGRYWHWHYGRAFTDLYRIWGNLLWFVNNFFSISLLFRTLFSPWKRLTEPYKKGLDIGAFVSALIVNTLMRIVGAFARSVIIALGLFILALVFVLGLVAIVVWALLPVVIIGLLVAGIGLLVL